MKTRDVRSFEAGVVDRHPISQGLLRTVRKIGEYKGKQDLYKQQSPQVLNTLRQAAVVQSIESSNRIEGIEASPARINELVLRRDAPRNRTEQEIAGYREVLDTIHANWPDMKFSTGLVLQLHGELFQYTGIADAGQYKRSENAIVGRNPDGSQYVRFTPVQAFRTPDSMEVLHHSFRSSWEAGEIEYLILIANYVLDFLCIHPFRDGNGRMARLLALLLLYQAGYEVGRYISLEKMVEETDQGYYESLYSSSKGWHEAKHDLSPWWNYFMGVMVLGAYRKFETRVGLIQEGRGAKAAAVQQAVTYLPDEFQYADVERFCPGVSRPTINRVLRELRKSGAIRCVKPGRDAIWRKTQT